MINQDKLIALKNKLADCMVAMDDLMAELGATENEPTKTAVVASTETEAETDESESQEVIPAFPSEDATFAQLKKLLNSSAWPAAVDKTLICDPTSEADKLNRAEGILELLIEESVNNKKILDFGCGEGHIPARASKQEVKLAVGYDIKQDSHWDGFEKSENLIFTSDIAQVEANKPYDVILLYDVLDHTTLEDAQAILSKAASLLADTGTIYLRVHPFCSRHATHLYHQLNKAYIHLVFTQEELEELGIQQEPSAKVLYPIATYEELINKANLTVASSNIIRERVETFFKNNPTVANRIVKHFTKIAEFPRWQLEQQFLDYTLKRK